ncbi:MAG: hypothetical protein GY721_14580, partial [Deltaproteobacteria bacterium]|nr:hypothetical protein [Deltaproteobacteria bacterium]
MLPILRKYQQASQKKDRIGMKQQIEDLLMLPQRALIRTGFGRARIKRIVNQLDRANGKEVAIDQEAPEEVDKPNPDPVEAKVRRAAALVAQGNISRAARSLMQKEPMPWNEASRDRLKALHPTGSDPNTFPRPPPQTAIPILVIDPDWTRKIIRKAASGASPGPSGWTEELLLPITQTREGLHLMGALLRDICNGVVEGDAREMLTAAKLIEIQNGDKTRPITMQETFVKIAALYALKLVEDKFPKIFEPIQFGIGTKGGPEKAAHVIQGHLEMGGSDAVNIKTDFTNAFNSVERKEVFRTLYNTPGLETMYKMCGWAYGAPTWSMVVVNGEVKYSLESTQGVKQGDPLAAFLFALTVHPGYEKIVRNMAGVRAVAVLDDLNLVGKARQALEAFEEIQPAVRHMSLSLKTQKCSLLWAHSVDPPEWLVQKCRQLRLKIVRGA